MDVLVLGARGGLGRLVCTELAARGHRIQTVTRDDSGAWTGPRGRIGPAHFEALLHEPMTTLCFVCGPETFVNESVATLRALGVPKAHIRTESGQVQSTK